jgi:hypothetical protein
MQYVKTEGRYTGRISEGKFVDMCHTTLCLERKVQPDAQNHAEARAHAQDLWSFLDMNKSGAVEFTEFLIWCSEHSSSVHGRSIFNQLCVHELGFLPSTSSVAHTHTQPPTHTPPQMQSIPQMQLTVPQMQMPTPPPQAVCQRDCLDKRQDQCDAGGLAVAQRPCRSEASVTPGLATSASSDAVSRDCFPLPLQPDILSLRARFGDNNTDFHVACTPKSSMSLGIRETLAALVVRQAKQGWPCHIRRHLLRIR